MYLKPRGEIEAHKKALALLDKLMVHYRTIYGPTDRNMGVAFAHLFYGRSYGNIKNREKCQEHYEQCEKLLINIMGEDHPLMLPLFQYWVDDYNEMELRDEAINLNKRFKKATAKYFGKENIFHIAYNVDYFALYLQTNPNKSFHKVSRLLGII